MQFKLKHTCKLRVPRRVSVEELERWVTALKVAAKTSAASHVSDEGLRTISNFLPLSLD